MKYDFKKIAQDRIALGEKKREDAAYGGEHHDGGGGAIIDEAHAFLAGLDSKLPEKWFSFVQAREKEEQEERDEYKRLKAKFEGEQE